MQTPNTIILSLGSNLGNRALHLREALDQIELIMGNCIALSKIYESPAWGFTGATFYNCIAVLHSQDSAETILHKIGVIEKKMGRFRTKTGYESRNIDVDIIAFNHTVITTHNLIIPHPQLQNRRFVLEPMAEVCPQWTHPLLNKTTMELLLETTDTNPCFAVGALENLI